jgi:hypothetical protein
LQSWKPIDQLIPFSVLDASTGKPAEGVLIRLQQLEVSEKDGPEIFHPLAKGSNLYLRSLQVAQSDNSVTVIQMKMVAA